MLIPKIYDCSSEKKIEISLNKHIGNVDHLEIVLPMKNKDLVLDLRLNIDILSKGFKQIFQENGKLKVNQPNMNELGYCNYKGRIKYNANSWATLSICDGITGTIIDDRQNYFIEKSSRNDSNFHYVYITPVSSEETQHSSKRRKRSTTHPVLDVFYNTNRTSRYFELGLVFDNVTYKKLGSVTKVTNYATYLVSRVNAYYSRVNIFVILVGVMIWNERDAISLGTDFDVDDDNFWEYATTDLVNEFHFDAIHLIRFMNSTDIGVYFVGCACNDICTALTGYDNYTLSALSKFVGGNLGLMIDTEDCECPEKTCIMEEFITPSISRGFSSCSLKTLRQLYEDGNHFCLKNKPELMTNISASCGNGVLEVGEDCDCGLETYCENHCCNPINCKLKKNDYECATGLCCDLKICKLKEAATVCRRPSNECDLPEFCTGNSQSCPEDFFKLDTEICDDGNSYCHQGFCGNIPNCEVNSSYINEKYMECKKIDSHLVNENNYCKTISLDWMSVECNSKEEEFITCSQPKYEILMYNTTAVGFHTSIYGKIGSIMVCTLVMTDSNAERVKNASLCNKDGVQCLKMSEFRKQNWNCPVDCHNNGWCNNNGKCHCKEGYLPPNCEPDVSGHIRRRNVLLVATLGVIALIGLIAVIYFFIKKYVTWGTALSPIEYDIPNELFTQEMPVSEPTYEEIFEYDYVDPLNIRERSENTNINTISNISSTSKNSDMTDSNGNPPITSGTSDEELDENAKAGYITVIA